MNDSCQIRPVPILLQLYCVASDGTSLDQLPPGQYVEYTDEQGNRMLVQCNGSPVSSEQEASPSPEVPETVIETAPQVCVDKGKLVRMCFRYKD